MEVPAIKDSSSLKAAARRRMAGGAPAIYLASAFYVAAAAALSALGYAATGYDRYFDHLREIMPENPYISFREMLSGAPPILPGPAALALLLLLAGRALRAGYLWHCLNVSRGFPAAAKDVFSGFALFGKIAVLELLRAGLIALYTLLFIAPGVKAYYSYRQAVFVLLDNPGRSPLWCLRESKRLMAGQRVRLFLLDVSFAGWAIIDLLVSLFAGARLFSIWLAPYVGLTRALFYGFLASPRGA